MSISELAHGLLTMTLREPSVRTFHFSDQGFDGELIHAGLPLFGRHGSQEPLPLIRRNRLLRALYFEIILPAKIYSGRTTHW